MRIGLVFEIQADAEERQADLGGDLSHYYHWREPFELDAVEAALRAVGHEVIRIGTPQQMARDLSRWRSAIDLVFNMSVGFVDRFRLSAAPTLFELIGLPYSGGGPFVKMVSQNKDLLKAQLRSLGVPTPPWALAPVGEMPARAALPDWPCIVKPVAEGSSVGVWPESVVHSRAELEAALVRLWDELAMDALVEEFIVGREMKVVMLGDPGKAFEGIIEDVDANGASLGDRILYFDVKSTGVMGKQRVDPTAPGMDALLADCRRVYRHFGPVDYASFDVRLDGRGHHFLEFQTDATLHPERTLARCCELNGMAYAEAIQLIASTAINRAGLADTPAR